MAAREAESGILYEPDERAPAMLATGLGLQFAILTLSSMIRDTDDGAAPMYETDILTVRVEATGADQAS